MIQLLFLCNTQVDKDQLNASMYMILPTVYTTKCPLYKKGLSILYQNLTSQSRNLPPQQRSDLFSTLGNIPLLPNPTPNRGIGIED